MKISVILPNYNGEKYLERAINSFLDQKYEHKELVIVDGISTDGSHSIIERYVTKHSSIKWIKEKDRGISHASNIGFRHSTGDILSTMGGDDMLYEGVFQCIAYHSKLIDFDAIYFDSYTYRIKEKTCILRKCPDVAFTKESLLSLGTLVGGQNIFFKRKVYDKYPLDEDNKTSMDYEHHLRISGENYLYLYVERVATINVFDNNISSDNDNTQFLEACKVAEMYSSGYSGDMAFSQKKKKKFGLKLKNVIRTIYHEFFK